jgi:nitrite reductase/ring-hydroxylating ferredoxin subunit
VSAAPISLPSMSAMSLAVSMSMSMSMSMSILRRGARRPIGEPFCGRGARLARRLLADEEPPDFSLPRSGRQHLCFSSACMHRGAPAVREPTGAVRNLRCQHHAWTYSTTDGELLAVTDERDFVDLCKADKGLPQVNCDPWGGWVCVDHLQPPSQASQGVRGQGRSRDGAIPA